jgi:carboxypeptidase C (cathepsin A)
MKRVVVLFAALSLAAATAMAAAPPDKKGKDKGGDKPDAAPSGFFKPESTTSSGSVSVEGRRIDYQAVAGTLVVHAKGWDDAAKKPEDGDDKDKDKPKPEDANPNAEASMFYVAYFKRGAEAASRPITFVFNGGPGSSTMWLHIGAFGPRRVVTADDTHTPPAPYRVVNNDFSLLDASDLVFVDAPGTGFSRVAGKDKEKAFFGVDPDATAFCNFVTQFLSKYGRWNSSKYLFGESYGTPRASVMVNELERNNDVDMNGVILLSAVLSFDMGPDGPANNPGVDIPYQLALPTYAATAWYHHKIAAPELGPLLEEVKHFAMHDYALALAQGANLPDEQRNAIAEKLHEYTGLPVDYILKADLRIAGGEFEKNLLDDEDQTTGRLDTRFAGTTLDPLSKSADYDPQSAAISAAYVGAFNNYVRKDLHYGEGKVYRPTAYDVVSPHWVRTHMPPGGGGGRGGPPIAPPNAANVIPDLASAMKYNPDLKVFLAGGYFDLATPFFAGMYQMAHLPMPEKLQSNIEYHYYQSGHMVYAHEASLKQLHDNVAAFIRKTGHAKGE